jgi:hypothetical protein
MRNIRVLPTDKPSRLYSYKSIDLYLHSEIVDANSANLNCKNQNIYITNDEEIKEGDWFMSDFNSFPIHNIKELSEREGTLGWEQKDLKNNLKIILTTDDLLIKDGVQDIDDDFLEWFVKNSSCEFVKTELLNVSEVLWEEYFKKHGVYPKYPYYEKIIIPKEEPKQETIEEVVNNFKKTDVYINEIKQEQDKKLYSEEEVLELLNNLRLDSYSHGMGRVEFLEWFEQFKKK